jgi:hypothetical protein
MSKTHCEWQENQDGMWETACNHAFEFNNAELDDENSPINFCMFCGKPMDLYPWTEPTP